MELPQDRVQWLTVTGGVEPSGFAVTLLLYSIGSTVASATKFVTANQMKGIIAAKSWHT
jgi:hypothetical protein